MKTASLSRLFNSGDVDVDVDENAFKSTTSDLYILEQKYLMINTC